MPELAAYYSSHRSATNMGPKSRCVMISSGILNEKENVRSCYVDIYRERYHNAKYIDSQNQHENRVVSIFDGLKEDSQSRSLNGDIIFSNNINNPLNLCFNQGDLKPDPTGDGTDTSNYSGQRETIC